MRICEYNVEYQKYSKLLVCAEVARLLQRKGIPDGERVGVHVRRYISAMELEPIAFYATYTSGTLIPDVE